MIEMLGELIAGIIGLIKSLLLFEFIDKEYKTYSQ
jgi:hypothetical protein